jgi:adenylosuccinate lyase
MEALSPLDGRYAKQLDALRPFFSEQALFRARTEVEVRYFIALSRLKELGIKLTGTQKTSLTALYEKFTDDSCSQIKAFEKTTNHDVKAVEYFIKERAGRIAGLKAILEFVHFGLTSEDVNNLAYGLLIHRALHQAMSPVFCDFMADFNKLAADTKTIRLLSLTHGQPATPTTLGKEMTVFISRLYRQLDAISKFKMQGKLGGAVGNFSAHIAAYPQVKWEKFRDAFVKDLGMEPLSHTTQINPHDDLAELSHMMVRLNTILIDFSRDMWMYISRGVFAQKVIKHEVGSSAMPHKVNPIDFENAEGNLGLSNALFNHFAQKLPISRLQRDLSDSTVQRNIGVAFGYQLLAVLSLRKGLSKVSPDKARIQQELDAHPEVFAEAIQMVLRKHGVSGAYEKLKALTRGEKVTKESLRAFIRELRIPEAERQRLAKML